MKIQKLKRQFLYPNSDIKLRSHKLKNSASSIFCVFFFLMCKHEQYKQNQEKTAGNSDPKAEAS